MNDFPVAERINRAMFEVLSTVNTSNGYSYDLTFQRIRRKNHSAHLCCVQVDTEPETFLAGSPFGSQEVERVISVECYVTGTSDGDETPLAEYHSRIQADLTRAVMQDPQLGGLCQDISPEESQLLFEDDGTNCGLAVGFKCRYAYSQADMTRV